MFPPFISINSSTLWTIETYRFVITPGSIASHSSFNATHNLFLFRGRTVQEWTWFSRIAQTFSIIFISALYDAHGRTGILWDAIQSVASFDVCFGLLSRWKIRSDLGVGTVEKVSGSASSSIWTYFSFISVPWIRINGPTPWAEMTPHTLMFPPPCLTCFLVKRGSSACPSRL